MNSYQVLVVDDDPRITSLVSENFRARGEITIHTANSAKDAIAIIEGTFLQLAFVDMQLSRNTPDGMGVFNFLRNNRPSCEVILLTAFPDVYRKELFTLLNPKFPQIRSALDKGDFSNSAPDVIQSFAGSWLQNEKTIYGVDWVATELATKVRREKVEVTLNEIDYVLSRVLGQGEESRIPGGLAREEGCSSLLMRTIALNPLEGGRSRSVVTAGRPSDDAGSQGIWCVMKVGPRAETEQEYSRYRSYVHFSVALAHRVELLGHAFGDTCGAICYSFAGKSPESVRSLYEIFDKEEDPSPYLRQMFSVQNRELYSRRGAKRTLASYFNTTYALEGRSIRPVAEELLRKLSFTAISTAVRELQSLDLTPINAAITHAIMQTPFDTCIVHGDMNAGNVIVAEDGRVIYIDYARSGCGPRAVDFAALEASLRLATCPRDFGIVLALGREEDRLWTNRWDSAQHESPIMDYWGRVSANLAEYARHNFSDLTEREYAATCLLWGARLFRVTQLSSIERLRILLWMLCCAKRI